ncbi:MAG: hypothetical protein ACRD0P_32575 [Stackebrandtia sp.]
MPEWGSGVDVDPEVIRGQARQLVADAKQFDESVRKIREGFKDAATDVAPWFSAGAWGMFKRPAAAANDADSLVATVIKDIDNMGQTLDSIVKELGSVDTQSSGELDRIGKLVYSS